MKNKFNFLLFSSSQRSGILMLLFVILLLQLAIFGYSYFVSYFQPKTDTISTKKWLTVQREIDSLKQLKINKKDTIYPFNPNYITDYKGYKLGLSLEEIDRLHQFRAKKKFVNSAKEFQQVTQISDSLLAKLRPAFKFPDWVTHKQKKTYSYQKKERKIQPKNINTATKEDLMKIYGIGDKISDIILQQREQLGEFLSINQLQFIWGIEPSVFSKCKKYFFVKPLGKAIKININEADIDEIKKSPYFNYYTARDIVKYRSMNGKIKNEEDLAKIKSISKEKIKIITLYLDF